MSGKRFKVITLGCRTNQYESQAYIDQLESNGYIRSEGDEPVDLCIVNTCTVTETADLSSRQAVRQILRQNPGVEMVVTGCAAEKDKEGFALLGKGLRVISNHEKEELLPKTFPEESWPEFAIKQFEAHTRAFVKVQDGCNSFCTYCIIPYVRGRSRSRTLPSILAEVKGLVESGFKEIVLTGINIGDFDGAPNEGENPISLADLVRAVDQIEGVERLRLSSIDPDEVTDDLMEAVLSGRSTCPSFHIVLQSGSNTVLKRMNRKYTAQMFMESIEKMRRANRDFTFTTDVIVGFPGETRADFAETLALMREVQFAKVHMFPYSPRKRTRAALYPDQIPQDEMQKRKKEVLVVAEEIAFALREQYVGKTRKVLLESPEKKGDRFSGHTDNFLQVSVAGENLSSNTVVDVLLEENTPEGLRGRVV